MEQMELVSRQQPGRIAIDNLEEMKAALSGVLARYEHVVYTEAMLADAKADKKRADPSAQGHRRPAQGDQKGLSGALQPV